MSLVKSADMSTPSYANPNLFSLQGPNKSSSKRKIMYMTESFGGPTYDPSLFADSPSEELVHPSCATPNQLDPSFMGYELDYLVSQSPSDLIDEGQMRLKLQELEHALLGDEGNDNEPSMDLDEEWNPLRNMMINDSPKESTSSESSNLSSTSSTKEVTTTLRQLLFDCAAMISKGDFDESATMISELRQLVSIQGDPYQRIAAYMVEGLAARLASSGNVLYRALKCKEPPSLDRLAAMQILFEVCPCFKFGFISANEEIMKVIRNEKRVHIIDFDINQGNQYIKLIQSLAKQDGKNQIHLKLTGIDDPESVQRPIGGLTNIGQRLKALAEMSGVSFEFRAIPAKTPLVTPSMLECQTGETLVVNFAFQLHHLPDESVSTVNLRDQLLRLVKSLNPKLVTVVEQDVNTNTTPFLLRFSEVYSYYFAVFESLEATLPRDSQDRVNVEKQCLARDIVNIIACEGEERIERYEVAGKWRARMLMAGFKPRKMGKNICDMVKKVIKTEYCDKFKVKEEMGMLHFGWEDKNLIVTSAWT